MIRQISQYPCQSRIVECRNTGPAPADLCGDRYDRGDTWQVKQDEDQEGEGRCRGEIPACDQPLGEGRGVEFGFRCVVLFRIEHAERADDDLFGRQARENGDAGFPVQAERFEYGRTCLADLSQVGVFIMFLRSFCKGRLRPASDNSSRTRPPPKRSGSARPSCAGIARSGPTCATVWLSSSGPGRAAAP